MTENQRFWVATAAAVVITLTTAVCALWLRGAR